LLKNPEFKQDFDSFIELTQQRAEHNVTKPGYAIFSKAKQAKQEWIDRDTELQKNIQEVAARLRKFDNNLKALGVKTRHYGHKKDKKRTDDWITALSQGGVKDNNFTQPEDIFNQPEPYVLINKKDKWKNEK